MKTWTTKEALSIGWNKTKENIWFILAFMLIIYIASYLLNESAVSFLVNVFSGYLMASAFLRISRGHKVDFHNIWDDLSGGKFVQYLILMVVATIFIVLGFLLVFIPGIIIALMLSMSTYILMDESKEISWKGDRFWRAMKKSRHMTSGHKWDLFGFFLVVMLLNLLGALAFGLGLIVTIPVTCIALAHIYDALKNKPIETHIAPEGNKEEAQPSEKTHTDN